MTALKAVFVSPTEIYCENLTVKSRTPVLRLCRILTEQGRGHHSLLIYSGGKLSMVVKSIEKAAKLTVVENSRTGPVFGQYREQSFTQDA